MKPALITHEISARHDVPAGHPERPERYAAILDHIGDGYQSWQRAAAPLAVRAQLELVHSESYLDMVFDVTGDADEPAPLDADTWASKRGYECASRAVGGACLAVDMVMENKASTAFSLMRPPGHHAEPEQAMGFCLFSSAAIAARHAQQKWGLNRIAVVDFDVHHGNGTQACFWMMEACFMHHRIKCHFSRVRAPMMKQVPIKIFSICHWLMAPVAAPSGWVGVMIYCLRLLRPNLI